MNEWLAIDSGEYLYTSSFHALIAARLNALAYAVKRSSFEQVCQGVMCKKCFEQNWGLGTALYENLPFLNNSNTRCDLCSGRCMDGGCLRVGWRRRHSTSGAPSPAASGDPAVRWSTTPHTTASGDGASTSWDTAHCPSTPACGDAADSGGTSGRVSSTDTLMASTDHRPV